MLLCRRELQRGVLFTTVVAERWEEHKADAQHTFLRVAFLCLPPAFHSSAHPFCLRTTACSRSLFSEYSFRLPPASASLCPSAPPPPHLPLPLSVPTSLFPRTYACTNRYAPEYRMAGDVATSIANTPYSLADPTCWRPSNSDPTKWGTQVKAWCTKGAARVDRCQARTHPK